MENANAELWLWPRSHQTSFPHFLPIVITFNVILRHKERNKDGIENEYASQNNINITHTRSKLIQYYYAMIWNERYDTTYCPSQIVFVYNMTWLQKCRIKCAVGLLIKIVFTLCSGIMNNLLNALLIQLIQVTKYSSLAEGCCSIVWSIRYNKSILSA